jgi:crossover junction endodeoxyribonuclease RuvC
MIVLGVDPGTAMTGYGLVERRGSSLRLIEYGCLQTPSTDPLPQRLLQIHDALERLVEAHNPDLFGVERLFFNKNVQTAFAVGQARGVALLVAARHGLPVLEFGPHEVKVAVTGYGRAPKEQVQKMVQALLGMSVLPRPDDAADALAVAICSAHGLRAA